MSNISQKQLETNRQNTDFGDVKSNDGEIATIPDKTGENRDEKGRFIEGVSGNPSGRPKGSISITEQIKQKLEEIPEGEKETYLELLVKRILDKAVVDGDLQMIKQIWEHIDGHPRESVEVSNRNTELSRITKVLNEMINDTKTIGLNKDDILSSYSDLLLAE